MLKLYVLIIAFGVVHVTCENGVLLASDGNSVSGQASVSGSAANADISISGKADSQGTQDDKKTTTVPVDQTTAAVIINSAKAKGVPTWFVPGIVPALKDVYPSLSSADQANIRSYVNNKSISVDTLLDKLGKICDKLPKDQRDHVLNIITDSEYSRRDAATAIYESDLPADGKELFQGMVEALVNTKSSLVDQCTTAKGLAGSVNEATLAKLGVPPSIKTIDCSQLGTTLFPSK